MWHNLYDSSHNLISDDQPGEVRELSKRCIKNIIEEEKPEENLKDKKFVV